MKQWRRGLLVAALVLPGLALASIGKVSVLEGKAKRTNGTDSQPLVVGSQIELHDTIEVSADSNLKLMLTDERLATSRNGGRQQVNGPQEVSKEQWEDEFGRFVDRTQ